ncbi:MAG: hypothetical protein J0H23_04065 [Micrococcales bacterium]|nr:hypothetical protein [Micrococcales bacterium]OJX66195.1 MAG: hypothetical protein BGO94_04625 [Micrococcales bacterium 72-143]
MPRSHPAARRHLAGGLATALAAVLLLAGCTPGAPFAGPPTPQLVDGQHSSKLAASFQYGAFAVTAGYAVYDEVTTTLVVGTRWQNLSDDYATAPSRFGTVKLRLASGGEPASGEAVGWAESWVPPGESADLTFAWRYLPENPLEGGVLTVGDGGERVTTIALADGAGEQQLAAREVAVDRWADFGPHAVHVRGALLSAGHLSDNSQADAEHRVLRLALDVWNSTASRVGWVASDSLALRLPDGTVVKSRTTPSVREVVWSASEGSWVEFEVPDDALGDYDLLLFREAPGIFGEPVVGNEAVPIPITVTRADVAPAERPADAELPLPLIEPRVPSAGEGGEPAPAETPEADRTIEVEAPAVNAAGCDIQLTGAMFSPSTGRLDLDLAVSYRGADDAGGVFSVPPTLTLKTALGFAGRMAGALLQVNGLSSSGAPQRTVLTFFDLPSDFDPADAVLHLGRNARVAFAGEASPQLGSAQPLEAEAASAGEFTIDMQRYRVGYFTSTDLAPGMVQLQLEYTVTTSSDADHRTLFFNPTRQVYLSRDDGYVTVPSIDDPTGILQLEVGVPTRVREVFEVPRTSLEAGTIYLLVRSRDETDFPTPEGWLETTIPVVLGGTGSAAS